MPISIVALFRHLNSKYNGKHIMADLFEKLHKDCIAIIFSYLCAPQIKACALTCRTFAAAVKKHAPPPAPLVTTADFMCCAGAGHFICIKSYFGYSAAQVRGFEHVCNGGYKDPYADCIIYNHVDCIAVLHQLAGTKEISDSKLRVAAMLAYKAAEKADGRWRAPSQYYRTVLLILCERKGALTSGMIDIAKKCVISVLEDRRIDQREYAFAMRILPKLDLSFSPDKEQDDKQTMNFVKNIVSTAHDAGYNMWNKFIVIFRWDIQNHYKSMLSTIKLIKICVILNKCRSVKTIGNNPHDHKYIATAIRSQFAIITIFDMFSERDRAPRGWLTTLLAEIALKDKLSGVIGESGQNMLLMSELIDNCCYDCAAKTVDTSLMSDALVKQLISTDDVEKLMIVLLEKFPARRLKGIISKMSSDERMLCRDNIAHLKKHGQWFDFQ